MRGLTLAASKTTLSVLVVLTKNRFFFVVLDFNILILFRFFLLLV